MYRYETHLHTAPVSKCALSNAQETVDFYKALGYAGIFITNHFLDGNINVDRELPYAEKIKFYFSDYEKAKAAGDAAGLQVLCGVELSYKGTDFLIYGLDKQWYLDHPQIMELKKSEELTLMMQAGALVIQAHPYREAGYIDHIRLFPRHVHGVEVINATNDAFVNGLGRHYADSYGLLHFAGSDNHRAEKKPTLAGLEFDTPLQDEQDFVRRVKNNEHRLFTCSNPLLPKE